MASDSSHRAQATGSTASADDTERRLEQLEVRNGFAEDLLDTLNALVARQQAQIERLQAEVAELRRRREDDTGPAWRSLRDELPPHY
ncbi:SlyX family protein [Hydrogenophaga electricum]|uniref:SlyX protein n=1 Tax=Hydrogenophaga electricum TaxID=1230953 RepID=A0ABQ6C6D7_9BURK|nr:SlyX family protein [Hydrogenophaga electricum]GLS15902.1 hypothetical protein GCM10007935_33390 [Hydrogenophaga electricum]